MPTKYAEQSMLFENTHTQLYVSVRNLQVLNRVQPTLWEISVMHVPSKSLSLIDKVLEGSFWELGYNK